MTTKEQFLTEHNSLSPENLKGTKELLSYFKNKKPSLFKDNDYPIEKIRRPFILWLTSLSEVQKKEINNEKY